VSTLNNSKHLKREDVAAPKVFPVVCITNEREFRTKTNVWKSRKLQGRDESKMSGQVANRSILYAAISLEAQADRM
jgi:hypothetical protein